MPSLITSVSLFIRGSSRRVALAFIAFIIIVFTLSNTPSRDLRSIPHESYHHEAIVESSHTPFRPESCDPHAFPSDSMQKKLLNPPIAIHDFGPVWGPENHRQFKALCNCLLTNSCAPNQDKVVLISANHFEPWYSGSLSPRNGGESVW
ncbi:hypothetical protein DL93DRAFT_496979 [Clavulina sp. PMI_390]|nr:hypothetical protein DL93DRAFT_496979 [Clavulina sp. PMI_390]